MNQVLGFSFLLGGLFSVGAILQRRFPGEMTRLGALFTCLVVCADLAAVLWFADYFSRSSYELIATTLAWCHFSLVCFWCVCSRGPALLRIGLVGVTVSVLFLFFPGSQLVVLQMSEESGDVFLAERLRHRLVVTCVAAWIAGVLCRLRGWRWETAQNALHETAHRQPTARQAWYSMIGGLAALGLFYVLHWMVEANWTNTFDRDFSIAALGCLYATLMLGVLSMTACRFPHAWMGWVLVVMASGWALYKVENHWHDNFKSVSLRPGDWVQYIPWLLLGTSWWWLVWQHLSGAGATLQRTDQPLLPRPKLRHLLLGMVLICALLTGVKTRYFDRFDDLIRQDMRAIGGVVQPIPSAYADPPPITGLFLGQRTPERVLNNLGRLKELRRIGFDGSAISPAIMDRLEELSSLRELAFERCDLVGADFSGLSALSQLESFRLIDTPVEPADFRSLSRLPSLRHLALSDANLLSELRTLDSIETIDLSRSPGVDPQTILELNTANLRSVKFPTSPETSGWNVVPDPAKFPKLQSLQLALAKLEQTDVDRIRQFPELNQLELIGCRGGLEHLDSLAVERLSLIRGAVTPMSLAVLNRLNGPRLLTIRGHANQRHIQDGLAELVDLTKTYHTVRVDLRPDPNRGPPPSASPFGVMLQIRSDHSVRLYGLEIEFETLLELLRIGHCEFIDTRVRHGDKLLWPPEMPMSTFHGALNLHGASVEELSQIISASKQLNVLSLSQPQIHGEQWKMLAGLPTLVLQWSESLPDLKRVLGYFEHGSDTRIILHLYRDQLTNDEEAVLQSRLDGRLTIIKIDRRSQ